MNKLKTKSELRREQDILDRLENEWCDLYLGEHDACVQWGDQKRKIWRVNSDEQSEPYQDIR